MPKETRANLKPFVEIDFTDLPDGTLLDTIEDPNDPERTLFAIYRDNRVAHVEGFEVEDRVLVPISRTTEILRHVRFSRGAKPYDCGPALLDAIFGLFTSCVDMPREHIRLLSFFVLTTWLIEKLPIAPYVALVGLPSGKTTALGLLNLLCRHSVMTNDITSASFYELCDRVTPTVLIDDTATAGNRSALFHLLRAGSTKGPVAIRKSKAFNAYGPKVFCWIRLPDDAALNSRCIIIPLQDTTRIGPLRPTDPIILDQVEDLQQMLQQYRFENFNRLSLAAVPGDECLYSRNRDLYKALALPIADCDAWKFLVECFKLQQDSVRESLSPVQVAVLQVLESCIHENLSYATCTVSNLTVSVNWRLQREREPFRASPRQVGYILNSLGLTNRKRTNTGYVLEFSRHTRESIHKLARRYGIELDNSVNRESCDFCMGLKTAPTGSNKATPGPQKATQSSGPEGEESEHGELRALEKA